MEGKTFCEVWIQLLHHVVRHGLEVGPRGKLTKELVGTQLVIQDAYENILVDPRRALNYRFLVAQWLTTQLGIDDLPHLLRFNKNLAGYEDDGHGGHYPSYGPRLRPQWPYLMKCFRRDPDTRQAVMSIWEAQLAQEEPRYIPCTLSLQFLLRADRLHTVATLRSSDAWLGLPYDVYNFTMLANFLAAELSWFYRRPIRLGTCTLNLGSSHLYEQHWEKAQTILSDPGVGHSMRSPRLPSTEHPPLEEFLTRERSDLEAMALQHPWQDYGLVLTAATQFSALGRLSVLEKA